MALRLIKKGNKMASTFSGTCYQCGSKFEADRKDLIIRDGDQREPGEWAEEICTECKGRVILNPKR